MTQARRSLRLFTFCSLAMFSLCSALAEEPQYGGDLNVGSVYVTLSPLSWDPADWNWKINHDTGMVREQLLAADLALSEKHGGPYPYVADAYIPVEALRGELAERWYWEDDKTLIIELRRGVMFPAREGLMAARELDAEDVLYTFNYIDQSPKRIRTYFEHLESVEARGSHAVVFRFSEYNAEWAYRFGYGYYSAIIPREMAGKDAKSWRNVVGTGPFFLSRYVQSNSQTYTRNPGYWDSLQVAERSYQLPFIDSLTYRIIKDEATYLTALRTGKIDILEAIRWIAVDHLKETTPELKWHRWLGTSGNFISLRVDRKPFDDIRVRRAMNLAINQQEIVDLFYGGHAELMAYPQHPAFGENFQPLEEMPQSVRELFEYHPEKARRLLAEAGYPDGFEVDIQVCSCSAANLDLIPLLDDYLSKVGVKLNVKPLEYASFLSMMTSRNHTPMYLMGSGHVNPTSTLRKSFKTGQVWNPSMFSDPDVDRRIDDMHSTRDDAERVQIIHGLTVDMLDTAPYVWLPTGYVYTAWWPWVKNYNGELRAGAVRPGPIYARLWIDEKMKREMGFE
jgi:peptide/nickel transport system substrate-binding protein